MNKQKGRKQNECDANIGLYILFSRCSVDIQ